MSAGRRGPGGASTRLARIPAATSTARSPAACTRYLPAHVAGRAGRVQDRRARATCASPASPTCTRATPGSPRCGTTIRGLVAATFEQVLSRGRARTRSTPAGASAPASASRRRKATVRGAGRRSRPPPSTWPRPSRPAGRAAGGSGRTTPSTRTTVTDVVLRSTRTSRPRRRCSGVDAGERVRARCACGCSVAGCRRRLPGLAGGSLPVAPDDRTCRATRSRYGPDGRPRRIPKRITISTMDRLLAAAHARRRRPGRLPRRRHADARRRRATSLGPTSAATRSPRATRTSARPASGDAPDAASRRSAPPSCGDASGAARLRAPPRSTPASSSWTSTACDATASRRRYARLGRALRAQRPGHDARLRRAGPGRARSALERAARPRGRPRPERHPLGQPRQAVGAAS